MKTNTHMKSVLGLKKQVLLSALVAAGMAVVSTNVFAATATGALTVNATLTNSCTVSAASLTFDSVAALASSSDVTGDTAGSLLIACTTGTSPTIWSDTARTLVGTGGSFAFNLSQTSGAAADDLPVTTGAAEALAAYTATGSEIAVPIYGKILASNFGSQPAAADYTVAITLSINY